jgi:hypothetical protein
VTTATKRPSPVVIVSASEPVTRPARPAALPSLTAEGMAMFRQDFKQFIGKRKEQVVNNLGSQDS